jgi:hypothetical protein
MKDQSDRVLYEPTRFKIAVYLTEQPKGEARFMQALDDLKLKHQNSLSAHSYALADAGFIKVVKTYSGRKPLTILRALPPLYVALDRCRETLNKLELSA